MAVAFVQDEVAVEDSGNSFASIAKAFGSNVTTGNLIIVTVGWGSNDQTPTVTDSQSNTYTLIRKDFGASNQGHASYYAKNVTGGAVTVTASFSPSSPYNRLGIMEVSGADQTAPLDQSTGQEQFSNGGTDGISSGAVTTGAAGEFIYGATQNVADGGVGLSAGTGFTLRETVAGVVFGMESQVQGAAGSVAATFTWASGSHDTITHVATFKAVAGATEVALTGVVGTGAVGTITVEGQEFLATVHQAVYRG